MKRARCAACVALWCALGAASCGSNGAMDASATDAGATDAGATDAAPGCATETVHRAWQRFASMPCGSCRESMCAAELTAYFGAFSGGACDAVGDCPDRPEIAAGAGYCDAVARCLATSMCRSVQDAYDRCVAARCDALCR